MRGGLKQTRHAHSSWLFSHLARELVVTWIDGHCSQGREDPGSELGEG